MNENKRIRRSKYALNHEYKNNNGRNLQFIKLHLLTLSLPTEEVFQENGQSRPAANLPDVDFHC